MSRYSVIYLFKKQYFHISTETYTEADTVLRKLYSKKKKTPLGIYDAKTELFSWEPVRRQQYNRLTVQEQGKLGNEMIAKAQALRDKERLPEPTETRLQADVLQRPVVVISN